MVKDKFQGLKIGVSQVQDGDMSVLYSGEQVAMANRKKFVEKVGLDFGKCIHTHLQHKQEIVEVTAGDGGRFFRADGLMTAGKGVGLVIVTGDCLPVVMDNGRQLALVHVSRKNIGIVKRLVEKMGKDGQVWIGPCIKKESYVWPHRNVLGSEWDEDVEKKADGWHIDLLGRVVKKLTASGVKTIEVSNVDTAKDTNYFSHYRAMRTGELEGRFMTVVALG